MTFSLASILVASSAVADVVTRCDGCGVSGYKLQAIAAAQGDSQLVYVVDNTVEVVKKYNVVIEEEPGSYVAMAREQSVEQEFKDHATVIWTSLAELKFGYQTQVPSVTEYMRNASTRGTVNYGIQSTFFNPANRLRFQLNNGVLAAFDLDQPAVATLNFVDGSEIKVNVNFAIEYEPDTSFRVTIASLTIVEGSARLRDAVTNEWIQVPSNAGELNGYSRTIRDENAMNQMQNMARHYGALVTATGSGSGGFAFSCVQDGPNVVCNVRRF